MALSKIKGTVIADDAINADRIADGTVVASDLLDNTLTGAKLATDIAISTSGNITTTGAFTSTGIDDNATSTAITIDSSERVGIGTSSPDEALHIYKGANSSIRLGVPGQDYAYRLRTNVSSSVNGGFLIEDAENENNLYEVRSKSSGRHVFSIDGSEAMRIDSSGNVGIGTSSPN